jgi:DNA recombination protein RmuC
MSCSKPQKTGPLLDDKENNFIVEMTKQINKIHEENNKRIEEILAKHRDEIRTTAEERDAKHQAEIKEIHDKHKKEIEKLNAKHDAEFAAEIKKLQDEHQDAIRKIQEEYATLATELREERAQNEQLRAQNQQLATKSLRTILQEKFEG